MNSTEIVDTFRRELNDVVEPYLHSDEEVFSFLDHAQVMFCRLTDGIADSRTADVTQLNVTPNAEWYSLHPSVLQIRSATRPDTGQPVEVISAEDATRRRLFFTASTGPVLRIVTGLEEAVVRTQPIPNETVTLNLSVYRLPLVTITNFGDQTLEIPAQHHIHLLDWMKFRAYSKHDVEVGDPKKAAQYESVFRAYCAQVKREQERARRSSTGLMAYGGI